MENVLPFRRTDAAREAMSETIRLIHLARGGDEAAFEAIIRNYERRVLKVAYRMVGNLHDAQDVAQEVFVRLWKHLDKIRDEEKFSTWLYRMVMNASYDLLAVRKRSASSVSLDDPQSGSWDLSDDDAIPLDRRIVARDLQSKVVAALDRLTPSERVVFVLRDLEGVEVVDIATIQDINKITVRRHLSTARQKMRTVLIELYPGFARQAEAASIKEATP